MSESEGGIKITIKIPTSVFEARREELMNEFFVKAMKFKGVSALVEVVEEFEEEDE